MVLSLNSEFLRDHLLDFLLGRFGVNLLDFLLGWFGVGLLDFRLGLESVIMSMKVYQMDDSSIL